MLRAIAITIALGHVALFLALGGRIVGTGRGTSLWCWPSGDGDDPGSLCLLEVPGPDRRLRQRPGTVLQNSPFLESVSSDADKLLRTRDPSAACVLKNVSACVFDALQKNRVNVTKAHKNSIFRYYPP